MHCALSAFYFAFEQHFKCMYMMLIHARPNYIVMNDTFVINDAKCNIFISVYFIAYFFFFFFLKNCHLLGIKY